MNGIKMIFSALVVPVLLMSTPIDSKADCRGEVEKYLYILNQIDGEMEYVSHTNPKLGKRFRHIEKYAQETYRQVKVNMKDGVLDDEEKEYLQVVTKKLMHNMQDIQSEDACRKLRKLNSNLERQAGKVRGACRE